jgi:uncharacterized protein (DUF1810 family)
VTGADPYNLQRFLDAQQDVIDDAIAELRAGSKQTHCMWFVFPQLAELGHSPTAKFFGLGSIEEARAYLAHPILGRRLRACAAVLLPWAGRRSAEQIFGPTDTLKLRSSLTLFDKVERRSVFSTALDCFFGGERDPRTLALLNGSR